MCFGDAGFDPRVFEPVEVEAPVAQGGLQASLLVVEDRQSRRVVAALLVAGGQLAEMRVPVSRDSLSRISLRRNVKPGPVGGGACPKSIHSIFRVDGTPGCPRSTFSHGASVPELRITPRRVSTTGRDHAGKSAARTLPGGDRANSAAMSICLGLSPARWASRAARLRIARLGSLMPSTPAKRPPWGRCRVR